MFHNPLVSLGKSIPLLPAKQFPCPMAFRGVSLLEKWPGAASLLVSGSTKGTEIGQSHAPGWETAPSEALGFPGVPCAGISFGLSVMEQVVLGGTFKSLLVLPLAANRILLEALSDPLGEA